MAKLSRRKGVTRLCHFTRLSSLEGIIRDGCIKPSSELLPSQVNDGYRLDGHQEFVCCSIMCPNVFLLNTFAGDNLNAWCVLHLQTDLLWKQGTKFCPVNASTGIVAQIHGGVAGFIALYQTEVNGPRKTYQRKTRQPCSIPTNNQAEVLVQGSVPLELISRIVIPSRDADKVAHSIVSSWPSSEETLRCK